MQLLEHRPEKLQPSLFADDFVQLSVSTNILHKTIHISFLAIKAPLVIEDKDNEGCNPWKVLMVKRKEQGKKGPYETTTEAGGNCSINLQVYSR